MVKEIHVDGYSELENVVKDYKEMQVFVLFYGSLDSAGKSWCSDCDKAHPVILKSLEKAPESAIFIHCSVGDRETWKDPDNAFRKSLKITSVPTILNWNEQSKKIVEEDCFNPNLVEMLLTDED